MSETDAIGRICAGEAAPDILDSMIELAELARRVLEHFESVEEEIFRGDPAANPRLKVEVLDPELVEDTPTLVLVTPWTLNGMAFPPDDEFPASLDLGKRRYQVFRNDLEGIGFYCSVNLVGDVGNLHSPDAARGVGRPLGKMFRTAVAHARQESEVSDPNRRDLFKRR